jgi:hypothetical protein
VWLASDDTLAALTELSGVWIDRVHERKRAKTIVLDVDSSESPSYGEQEGSAYNGHFGCTCYHPLFCFNQFGGLERCLLRPGNVHSAEDWRLALEPVVVRYRDNKLKRYFRADAAFASPDVYDFLEAEEFLYAIRLSANTVVQLSIAHLLRRPVGRPPNSSGRWPCPRRWNIGRRPPCARSRSRSAPRSCATAALSLSSGAEVAIPRPLFAEILCLIDGLRRAPLLP